MSRLTLPVRMLTTQREAGIKLGTSEQGQRAAGPWGEAPRTCLQPPHTTPLSIQEGRELSGLLVTGPAQQWQRKHLS